MPNQPNTPFPTTGYYGPKYFCDREKETKALLNHLKGGSSTTLISIRRMGKTGLIRHVEQYLPRSWDLVYMDILATENMQDLLNSFVTAVVNAIPEHTTPGKKIWAFIKSLRPVFSFDQLSGDPKVAFNVDQETAKRNLSEVFQTLEQHPRKVVIAIDEFQQVTEYPDNKADAWLRSIVQQLKNVQFIFAGSQQHLMAELFMDPSRPFYRSTQLIQLKEIEEVPYKKFIQEHFRENGQHITPEVVREILKWTRRHTYYVQLLCNRTFLRRDKKVAHEAWQEEAAKILNEQEPVFHGYRELLTSNQWSLLKSIAAKGTVREPTSKDFIKSFGLGSSSIVLRSLKALLNKEMVFYDHDEEGNKFYRVYDLLFERWIQNRST